MEFSFLQNVAFQNSIFLNSWFSREWFSNFDLSFRTFLVLFSKFYLQISFSNCFQASMAAKSRSSTSRRCPPVNTSVSLLSSASAGSWVRTSASPKSSGATASSFWPRFSRSTPRTRRSWSSTHSGSSSRSPSAFRPCSTGIKLPLSRPETFRFQIWF